MDSEYPNDVPSLERLSDLDVRLGAERSELQNLSRILINLNDIGRSKGTDYKDVAKAVEGIGDIQIEFLLGTIFCDRSPFRILDFGCGEGRLMLGLVWFDPGILSRLSYFGVDVKAELVERTKKLAESQVLPMRGPAGELRSLHELLAECEICTVEEFKGREVEFRYAFLVNVLHHIPPTELAELLSIVYRRLDPGGYMILHETERLPQDEIRHPWTLTELHELLAEVAGEIIFRKTFSKGRGVALVTLAVKKTGDTLSRDVLLDTLSTIWANRLRNLNTAIAKFRDLDSYDLMVQGFRMSETAKEILHMEKLAELVSLEYQELRKRRREL